MEPTPESNSESKPLKVKRSLAELLEAAATRPTLDAEEVGAYLGIGVSTAYRLIGTGVIPAFRIPGTTVVRVRRTVLDGLLLKWEDARRRGRKTVAG